MTPRGVWRICRGGDPSAVAEVSVDRGSIFVTGVLVCRFNRPPLISVSRMNATSLYGHNEPALAVSVAAFAPLTLCFRRSSSWSVMKVTSFPSSGAWRFNCSTSRATAFAKSSVQKVRQPDRERHSHGTSWASMYDLMVLQLRSSNAATSGVESKRRGWQWPPFYGYGVRAAGGYEKRKKWK